MVGHISDMADICRACHLYIGPNWFFWWKWQVIYRDGWIYIVPGRHISWQPRYISWFSLNACMPDIYHGFSCQIEFMAAHMSWCRIWVFKFGSSHKRMARYMSCHFTKKNQNGSAYACQPDMWATIWGKNQKWQLIWMPTRHMSNHFGKNSKMAAHVSRMAAHMSVFLCFPLCSPVPRPFPLLLPLRLRLQFLIQVPNNLPVPLPVHVLLWICRPRALPQPLVCPFPYPILHRLRLPGPLPPLVGPSPSHSP